MRLRPLPRRFFDRSTLAVARDLVGCFVVHRDGRRLRVARIVETEAYVGERDLACHASKGRTRRTEVMYGRPGHAYVFLVYGMHHCLNAVTGRRGFPAAVLLRAGEPVIGCRGRADGPGRLTRALAIDRRHDGADLCGAEVFLAGRDRPPGRIARGPRVGVDYAGAWAARPWRFFEAGNPHVSRGDPAHRRSRRTRDMGAP